MTDIDNYGQCKSCEKLADEIERLRGAYEQERQNCINLTEKVVPNLRADNDINAKLIALYNNRDHDEVLTASITEIERLRELVHGTIDRNGSLAAENARLRGLLRAGYGFPALDSEEREWKERVREALDNE